MKSLILLTDGFEDIEAFSVIDILRRANLDITAAGVRSSVVVSAHGVRIMAEKRLNEINPDAYDTLILPGGPGYKDLSNSKTVISLIKDFDKKKKLIAAICAAPLVLEKAGILEKRIVTLYPGLEKRVSRPRDAKVVVDGHIITSRSPGTAIDFALKLTEIMAGKNVARRVRTELAIKLE